LYSGCEQYPAGSSGCPRGGSRGGFGFEQAATNVNVNRANTRIDPILAKVVPRSFAFANQGNIARLRDVARIVTFGPWCLLLYQFGYIDIAFAQRSD
jgi:hypothetical protein